MRRALACLVRRRGFDAETSLQLSERLKRRISLLMRHAPTWRLPDHQNPPCLRRASPHEAVDKLAKTLALPAVSRVSPDASLTRKKGQNEGVLKAATGRASRCASGLLPPIWIKLTIIGSNWRLLAPA